MQSGKIVWNNLSAMPEDNAHILIMTRSGQIYSDTCFVNSDYEHGLEKRGDWEGVVAWAEFPKEDE